MHPGEQIIFQSSVVTTSLKRRSSKLLSIASVTPKKKQKSRELILTTNRVVCIKVEKGGRGINTKLELLTQKPAEKEKDKNDKERDKKKSKEKDISNNIISVDLKGEREFVVLTVSLYPSIASQYSQLDRRQSPIHSRRNLRRWLLPGWSKYEMPSIQLQPPSLPARCPSRVRATKRAGVDGYQVVCVLCYL